MVLKQFPRILRNLQLFQQYGYTLSRRTKFSDSFTETYNWKNTRNRPSGQDESNMGTEIDEAQLTLKTVYHLEQLSLVDFSNQAAIARLASAIRYANRLKDVDTENVEPLFSLLEDQTLTLRADVVTEGNQRADVLRNASVTMEDFYVAPPGNIPLEQKNKFGDASSTGTKNSALSAVNPAESSADLKKARRKA